jgi:hypothetical protein
MRGGKADSLERSSARFFVRRPGAAINPLSAETNARRAAPTTFTQTSGLIKVFPFLVMPPHKPGSPRNASKQSTSNQPTGRAPISIRLLPV